MAGRSAELFRASVESELGSTRLRGGAASAGLLMGVLRACWPARRAAMLPARGPYLVAANPVAHGVRLLTAAQRALDARGETTVLVADRRLADSRLAVGVDFPGLGVRSLAAWASLHRLREARTLLRDAGEDPVTQSASRTVRVYLRWAQALRFVLAGEVMRDVEPGQLLVTDFDRGPLAAPLVSAGRAQGVHTATLVHGAANAATYTPVFADRVLVWGPNQARMFSSGGGTALQIDVVGRIDMDAAESDPTPVRRVVLCHSMERPSGTELKRLRSLATLCEAAAVEVDVRLHPRARPRDLDEGWTSLVRRVGVTSADVEQGLHADLRPGDVVATLISTAAIDALCGGFRSLVLADVDRQLPCDLELLRDASVAWLRQAERTGLREADDLPSADPAVRACIVAASGADAAERLLHAVELLARP